MAPTIQKMLNDISQGLSTASDTALLDAQVLLAHFLGKPRSWLLAHPEARLERTVQADIQQAFLRLQQGEPLPYVIGHWEFFGLDFLLTHHVLIPRPETELLVERALAWLNKHPGCTRVADVGTGSGCIGIALAMHHPSIRLLMTDISPQALEVAQENARRYAISGRMDFQQADLLDGITSLYDLICANLPYIPSRRLGQLPVAKREPRLALDGGRSGLDLITRLLGQARNNLAPGGSLLLELDATQGPAVKTSAENFYPGSKVSILPDLSGLDRCVEISLSNYIIHLCPSAEWLEAQERGVFMDASLDQHGFIHCSQPQHVLQVANQVFPGSGNLLALWIDPAKITSEIRWEPFAGIVYPHIYGPIDLPAVSAVSEIKPDQDGRYRLLTPPDDI